jgi:hypothetical protein
VHIESFSGIQGCFSLHVRLRDTTQYLVNPRNIFYDSYCEETNGIATAAHVRNALAQYDGLIIEGIHASPYDSIDAFIRKNRIKTIRTTPIVLRTPILPLTAGNYFVSPFTKRPLEEGLMISTAHDIYCVEGWFEHYCIEGRYTQGRTIGFPNNDRAVRDLIIEQCVRHKQRDLVCISEKRRTAIPVRDIESIQQIPAAVPKTIRFSRHAA